MTNDDPTALKKRLGSPFAVRVMPGAAANRVKCETQPDGCLLLRVYVTAPPEDGKANKAVIALLAETLDVKKSALTIVRGQTDKNKLIRLDD